MSAQKKALPYLKVFGDWLVRFQRLDDAQFGRLVRAAIGYVCAGEEPQIDGIEGLSFDYIRPALDNDVVKYQEKVAKNSVNGAKGAVARWGTDSERHLSDGENSQEKREKKEEKRYKIDDTRVRDVPERPYTPTEGADVLDSAIEAFESAWRAYTDMLDETGHPLKDPGATLEHLTESIIGKRLIGTEVEDKKQITTCIG